MTVSERTSTPRPGEPPVERVRRSYLARHESDYVFSFWSALGWTLLTLGAFRFYVVYQLVRRLRDHNRRRLDLLEGARDLAWSHAARRGIADELRPEFERVGGHLGVVHRQSAEFRDPTAWMIIDLSAVVACGAASGFVPGILGTLIGLGPLAVIFAVYWLLDSDLVTHDYHEGAVETDLATIYGRLGHPVDRPDPARLHRRHNDVGRIVASLATLGLYVFWWMRNMMLEPNRHFEENWVWEDSLARAVQALEAATPV